MKIDCRRLFFVSYGASAVVEHINDILLFPPTFSVDGLSGLVLMAPKRENLRLILLCLLLQPRWSAAAAVAAADYPLKNMDARRRPRTNCTFGGLLTGAVSPTLKRNTLHDAVRRLKRRAVLLSSWKGSGKTTDFLLVCLGRGIELKIEALRRPMRGGRSLDDEKMVDIRRRLGVVSTSAILGELVTDARRPGKETGVESDSHFFIAKLCDGIIVAPVLFSADKI